MSDKNGTTDVPRQEGSSDRNVEDKTIMQMGTLSNVEEIFKENYEDGSKLNTLNNHVDSETLQVPFGDNNNNDGFDGFDFSNVEVSATDHSGLDSAMPNGDSVSSYSLLSNSFHIKGDVNNDTSNKKDTSLNDLENGDVDFNFMDWQ